MGHLRIRQTTQSGVMLEANEEMLNPEKAQIKLTLLLKNSFY